MPNTDHPAIDVIDGFRDDYQWLSNHHHSPLTWEGLDYATAEAAFAAGKTLDRALRARIAAAPSAGAAKRLGRQVPLRKQWDEVYRYRVMQEVLAAKFSDPGLRRRLIATGSALLVEANDWHDQHWGDCRCHRHRATPGRNELGRTLMRLRDEFTDAPARQWTRVACTGHRPHILPADSHDWVIAELTRIAAKLRAEHGTSVAISGGAMGSDLWWADAAHAAGTRVWLYQPFPQQADRWQADWKAHHRRVQGFASRVAVLDTRFSTKALFDRNDWMIRDCDALVAVVDPEHRGGGTHAAVASALGRRPIIRIDVRKRDTRLVLPRPSQLTQHDPGTPAVG
ncbi:SLOG family protein [Saccharothrix sp.]|uniref:SLOG family protein n=1 Tax=Saccharothrix sp. TaxID=1873460 RepID=UPI002812138A|nr:SLOG family protein [Saccharothrix sp.]